MMEIQKKLFSLQDRKYGEFQGKLMPNINGETIIGVRVPLIKSIAKELTQEQKEKFLQELPHKYYDENMLHSAILSNYKDYDSCLKYVEKFLPYVDNWAVCDTLRPKVFCQNKNDFLKNIYRWIESEKPYTCRYGIEMLMTYFLDCDYKSEVLLRPAKVKSEEYYVNMMIAWFYATALAKQWEDTVSYLTENILSVWVHNKTIQKAVESFRISNEQKEFLKTLKR